MLNDNIRKCRKAKQMSQDELAEKLGVTRQSISLWETGQTQPTLDNIVALAELFDISTDALLTDHNPEFVRADAAELQNDKVKRGRNSALLIITICIAVVSAFVITILLWGNGSSRLDDHAVANSGTVIDDEPTKPSNPQQSNEPEKPQAGMTEENGNDGENQSTATETDASADETSEKDAAKAEKPQTDLTETNGNDGEKQNTPPETASSAVETTEKDDKKDLYSYLKDFVIQKGVIYGDYCYYSKTADHYGGYSSEDFSLYYWGDTKTVEFCLHSVLDETFSINFYLRVPAKNTGEYEYISSYYYRDTGTPLYEARGVIKAKEFTENFPLNCDKYIGSTEVQNEFMEISREGICDLLACLEKFIEVEQLEYSFSDFGFAEFS